MRSLRRMDTASAQHASALPGPYVIRDLEPLPGHLLGTRRELNLLSYGSSQVLLAESPEGGLLGAIRVAMRDDRVRRHGLITDLQVHDAHRNADLVDALIEAAEGALRDRGARKIEALIPDGARWSIEYYRHGYWPSRKTLVVGWRLDRLQAPGQIEHEVSRLSPTALDEVVDLVLTSYQPYWRWWRERRVDRRWERVDYPAEEPRPMSDRDRERMEVRAREEIMLLLGSEQSAIFGVRDGTGQLVAICDAAIPGAADRDHIEYGVVVRRQSAGAGIGRALLDAALWWLREQGAAEARTTVTSGLDDYDPLVYLYALAGGQIQGEYVNLVKRRLRGTAAG